MESPLSPRLSRVRRLALCTHACSLPVLLTKKWGREAPPYPLPPFSALVVLNLWVMTLERLQSNDPFIGVDYQGWTIRYLHQDSCSSKVTVIKVATRKILWLGLPQYEALY